ncbi:hypothetical protein XELAEV_18046486mg [Xenopus laevis]|uniref:Uncharacterized protein n=1 Tax=Xenopus laevis TaxID=8355 RepID=A0A974BTE3_XENLA|nr:hypothetical protein XELAEV_18046486mg [Xenopus laevis]
MSRARAATRGEAQPSLCPLPIVPVTRGSPHGFSHLRRPHPSSPPSSIFRCSGSSLLFPKHRFVPSPAPTSSRSASCPGGLYPNIHSMERNTSPIRPVKFYQFATSATIESAQ